ncbi:WD repeat-containing protein on Y chromosome-like [Polypterus senegalus]
MDLLGNLTYKEDLNQIKSIFSEAELDNGGCLDMLEFRQAIQNFRDDLDEEVIDTVFMKVDVSNDGTINWCKYLDYTVQEYQQKEALQKFSLSNFFPKPMEFAAKCHSDIIVKLLFKDIPKDYVSSMSTNRNPPGEYLSISRDGELIKWSDDFTLLHKVNINKTDDNCKKDKWVIDMAWLYELHMVAVCTTYSDIEFFDLISPDCKKELSLTAIDNCAVTISYWSNGKKGVFCSGDDKGGVMVFMSSDINIYGLFNMNAESTTGRSNKISVRDQLKSKSRNHMCFRIPSLHEGWCKQIRYIPDLNAVVTCSALSDTGMVVTKLPYSRRNKIRNKLFDSKKGILCFDYSTKSRSLFTGGFDCIVREWNPYIPNNCMFQMEGHHSPVQHIAVNSQSLKIISISRDDELRVWDLLTGSCLQKLPLTVGGLPIFCFCYHESTNLLVVAAAEIGILYGIEKSREWEYTSHEEPLCTILYSSSFKQVVSGCIGGFVCVWDILTGKKVVQFMNTEDRKAAITAMAFDDLQRRLITGCKDGTVRIWNFNNGELLSDLQKVDKTMVTDIVYIDKKIYISGWLKRLVWYSDAKKDEEIDSKQWKCYHKENVRFMVAYDSQLLITVSYIGNIIAWSTEVGEPLFRFNPERSLRPLDPIRVFDKVHPVLDTTTNLSPSDTSTHLSLLNDKTRGKTRESSSAASERELTSSFTSQSTRLIPSKHGEELVGSSLDDNSKKNVNANNSILSSPQVTEKSGTDEILDKPKITVEKLYFLHSRKLGPDAATLLTSASDGYILAWSVHPDGGLLGKFKAVTFNASFITTMTTDENDEILITGDTNGYIKIWDIENYCCSNKILKENGDSVEISGSEVKLKDLIPLYCRIRGSNSHIKGEYEAHGEWNVCLDTPDLLCSFRSHLSRLVQVQFVARFQLIITASLDCNIRLWKISGHYIGNFGQSLWQLGIFDANGKVPIDLKRAGSYQTLKVLNEGINPFWRCDFLADFHELLLSGESTTHHFKEIAKIACFPEEEKGPVGQIEIDIEIPILHPSELSQPSQTQNSATEDATISVGQES